MPTPPPRFREEFAADEPLLRGWLPADRHRGVSFVGMDELNRPVAAFAVAPTVERYDPPGLAVAVHFEPGVSADVAGEKVLALAGRMAEAAVMTSLHAWPHPARGSPQADLFSHMGFVSFDALTTWAVDCVRAGGEVGQLAAWALDRLGPDAAAIHPAATARDVPLRDANPAAVLRLYEEGLAELGAARPAYADAMAGIEGPVAFDPWRSRALVGPTGRPIGFILIEAEGTARWIRALVTDRSSRDGLCALRLFAAALTADPPTPGRVLRFETYAKHGQSARLARRVGSEPVAVRDLMRRDLPRPSA